MACGVQLIWRQIAMFDILVVIFSKVPLLGDNMRAKGKLSEFIVISPLILFYTAYHKKNAFAPPQFF
jgi:hypothetical protein